MFRDSNSVGWFPSWAAGKSPNRIWTSERNSIVPSWHYANIANLREPSFQALVACPRRWTTSAESGRLCRTCPRSRCWPAVPATGRTCGRSTSTCATCASSSPPRWVLGSSRRIVTVCPGAQLQRGHLHGGQGGHPRHPQHQGHDLRRHIQRAHQKY